MTKEEYNEIVGLVELLGYQYCERNKIRLGTDTEFKRGLNEALKVMKKFIACPLHHVVIEAQDLRKTLSEIEDKCSRDKAEIPSYVKAFFVLTERLCDDVIKTKFNY